MRVIVNTPPVAKPGPNRVVPVHTPASLTPAVTLTGAAEDPDTGHAEDMDYEWSVFSAPASTTGSSTRSASAGSTRRSVISLVTPSLNGKPLVNKRTFTPTQTGDYVFTLTVRDPGELTHSANVTIHACSATGTSQWYETGETRVVDGVLEKKQTRWHNGAAKFQWVPPNHPPKAFAGYNDIVLPNTTVYLRGSSKDPDQHLATEMDYNWSLVEDVTETPCRSTTRVPQVTPLIIIASPTSKRTSFTAPAQAQTLRIRLTVTDPNGATDTDDVITQVHSGVGTTEWLDTRATRGCGATRDKEQMRRIDRRPHGEYRWTADPEDEVWSAWEDTDQTRNRNEGDWTDTDPLETMGTPPDVEKKQTRTITWEQEQTRTSETCGTIEPQWLEASETETRWVPVTPPPPVIPPAPTNDQWSFRYSSNKLQAKVISLPTVIPVITEVELTMETGQPPNLTTVVKTLDVADITIGEYTTVLSSADTGWQTGTWIAQIRFQNSLAFGPYSDVKSDTVPTPETCTWQDVSPPEIRNRVEGAWTDTGRTQQDPVDDSWEKEQEQTITWEKKQECTSGGTTHYRWVSESRTETRWVPDCTWVDVSPPEIRNRAEGSWSNTDETRWVATERIFERKQTRVVTWEKEQECTSGDATHYRWVSESRTETRWVPDCTWVDVSPPEIRTRAEGSWSNTDETWWVATERIFERKQTRVVTWEKKQECTSDDTTHHQWVRTSTTQTQWVEIIEVCGSWSDTGRTRVDRYGSWSRTGRIRNSGANRECEEERTVYREKEQSCTINPPYNNTQYRWVSTTSTTATQWVDCPEPVVNPCGPWSKTGTTRNRTAGTWADTGSTQGCGPDRQKRQSRTMTWQAQEQRMCLNGATETRWVSDSSTDTRWVDAPEALRWGEWDDTGQQRENQVLLIIEKEQQRTSHCGDTQTRWVVA